MSMFAWAGAGLYRCARQFLRLPYRKAPYARSAARRPRRLWLEQLESREVLSTLGAPPVVLGPTGTLQNLTPSFSWNAVAGATNYDVWVNDTTSGKSQVLRNQPASNSLTAPAPLPAGDSYQWWVRALNGSTAGLWSAPGTFTIALLATPNPTGPTGSIQGGSATFGWSAVTGAGTYDLWVSDLSTNQSPVFRSSQIASTSITVYLTPGHIYRWWVRALNASGDTSNWSTGTVFSLALATPTPVGPAGSVQNAMPAFSWNAVAGATYYDLWVNDTTSGQSQVIRNRQIIGNTLTPTSPLSPGHSYLWWVAAYVPGGNATPWSSGATFTVAPLPGASALGPIGSIQSTQPSFAWNVVAGADFYDVWVADVTTHQAQVMRNAHVSATFWTPSSPLAPGHQYQWWVRALSNNGDSSPWGQAAQFTIAYLTAPVLVNPAGPVPPGFTWNAVSGADYYDLWVSDLTKGTSQALRNTHVAAASFTPITPLPAGHVFQWWVRALSAGGNYSPWSSASAPVKFIMFQGGTISGSIFNDMNGDGTRQAGEPGLLGWSVQLVNTSGTLLQQITTDASGNYSFTGLQAGNYTVNEVNPTGWSQTGGSASYAIAIANGTTSSGNTFGNLPPVSGNVVIDAAWLAAQGNAPYVLNQADTTYTLAADVDVPGTAFVIGAANVILNLNGHTVTFGDSAPIQVTNGGFEQGSGSTVPGWNLTGAPGAVLKPARLGMWGSSMLEIPSFTTPQSIVSDAIAIPAANREYAATITPFGDFGTTVTLNVIDAVTGRVLGSAASRAVNRGFAAVVSFTPTTTHPVKLEVDVTPPSGAAATVDLDYAALFASRDFGIVASPGSWYFPAQLTNATIAASVSRAANFTVLNGSIVQGQGHSYSAEAIDAVLLPGLTVHGVTSFVNGMDSINLDGQYAINLAIMASTFTANIDNISNRMLDFAAIRLGSNTGNVLIDGNTILNYPQQGIAVFANTGTLTITNNKISQRAIVTDGYGIALNGVSNFVIANNTITPVQGRGILLDAWNSAVTQNGDIYGNYVSVSEAPNLEYGTALAVTALRIRNWTGAQRNVHIHGNTFSASTGIGGVASALGLRVTQQNDIRQATNDNLLIDNNTFKAVVTTTDSSYIAQAVSISGVDTGTGLQISSNVMESNQVSLNIGDTDSYGYHENDILMVGNTMTRSSDGAARTYSSVQVGGALSSAHNVRLIDTHYANGATAALSFIGSTPLDIETGYLLSILAQTSAGALAGAAVTIFDNTGAQVYSGMTDSTGQLSAIPLVTTTYTQATNDHTALTTTANGPFKVVLTFGIISVRQQVDLSSDKSLVFNI